MEGAEIYQILIKNYQLSVRRVKKIKKIFAGCLELMFLQPNT